MLLVESGMKRVIMSFLVLGLLTSIASADRRGGRGRNHHRGGATWTGGVSVRPAPVRIYRQQPRQQPRRVYVERTRVVRRPVYVQRPRIQFRYYNYYQRPTVIAENYDAMPGYYWVAGQWSWSGAEWVWYPGHYEPDQNYVDPGYSQPYDGAYYDGY